MEKGRKSAQDMLDKIQNVSTEEVKKEKKTLNIKSILIGFLVAILIGSVGFMVLNIMPKDQKVNEQVKVEKPTETNVIETYSVIKLPEWAKKPWDMLTEEDIKNMIKDQEDNFIGWTASALPSEENGFTSDKSKEYDTDGLPNEYFTHNTKEQFSKKMATIVNRVVNPIFGNWNDFQSPTGLSNVDILNKIYSNLGSPDYISSIAENKNQSVIFYDEKQDLYGGTISKPENGQLNRFIGIIKSGDMTFDQSTDKIEVKLNVDYMLSANQIYKTKVITLTLEGNKDGDYRIVGGTINDK